MGLSLQMSGATIFPTFTVPMNIMNSTIVTNPAFANFLAWEILSSNAKKDEIANRPTIGTAADTKTDLFGNSKGEKDDIVKSIKMPEITVASTMTMSFALRFADGPAEEGEDIFCEGPCSCLISRLCGYITDISHSVALTCTVSSICSDFVDQKVRQLLLSTEARDDFNHFLKSRRILE
jgi:hypothetical protein